MRSASSSVVLRLWFAACAFSESIALRSSVSRFLSWVYSASSPSRICAARTSLAFWSCSIWALTFCTSGWPSRYFSPSRPSSTERLASWELKPVTTGSAATCGSASSSSLRARISLACLSAASIAIRRACACTKSSWSLAIEVLTAVTLPSGTNRSWLL